MIELRLPFPVSVNDMYINNKGRGKGRKPSLEYRAWKDHAGWELNAQNVKPIDFRCEVRIDLDDTRQGDCDNRCKPVMDLLVTHGVLRGDQKKYVRRVSSGWEPVSGCRVLIVKEAA